MVKGLFPSYLCSIVSITVGRNSKYNIRNSNDFANIVCRISLYMIFSISSSVVNAWDVLPKAAREAVPLSLSLSLSLSSFKRLLNVDKPIPLYFYVERKLQVIHICLEDNYSNL